ncbi:MAG: hypothetical protein IJB26_04780 [Clostridia bacterium]|nr:hypothetical protein [Clostridia bacterium]
MNNAGHPSDVLRTLVLYVSLIHLNPLAFVAVGGVKRGIYHLGNIAPALPKPLLDSRMMSKSSSGIQDE